MGEEKDRPRRGRTDGPGTTSDPNQSNREPLRDRGAEQAREAPGDAGRRDPETTPEPRRREPD